MCAIEVVIICGGLMPGGLWMHHIGTALPMNPQHQHAFTSPVFSSYPLSSAHLSNSPHLPPPFILCLVTFSLSPSLPLLLSFPALSSHALSLLNSSLHCLPSFLHQQWQSVEELAPLCRQPFIRLAYKSWHTNKSCTHAKFIYRFYCNLRYVLHVANEVYISLGVWLDV